MAKIEKSKLKFIRNILICIFAIFIVSQILDIAPGYKRDRYKDIINLVLNEKNITEDLKNNIYISEKGTIYLSQEDIKNIFDPNIFYDENYNQIITTSDTKVANISINNKQITVNNSTYNLIEPIIKINDKIYLPISDMKEVYNIEVNYIESTNIVIIDKLNKGMIQAQASEDTEIKFKPRKFSKVVGELKKGQDINCFYTTSKGWREIRTKDGIVGYVKANKVTNDRIIRQDIEQKKDAKEISIKANNNGERYLEDQKIELVDLYSANTEDENTKIWGNIDVKSIQNGIESLISNYRTRTILIDGITSLASENKVNNINLDFTGVENKENIKRFTIELAPKLRDIGVTTSIELNNNIKKDEFIKIVDYIVKEK